MNLQNEKDLRSRRTNLIVNSYENDQFTKPEKMLEAAKVDTVLSLVALENKNYDSALVDLISAASCLALALGRPIEINRVKEK